MYVFRLFVADSTPSSVAARDNLSRILSGHLGDDYSLEVVDVLEDPGLAREFKVLATPMVIKVSPGPVRRVIGDMGDHQKTLCALGLITAQNTCGSKEGGQ